MLCTHIIDFCTSCKCIVNDNKWNPRKKLYMYFFINFPANLKISWQRASRFAIFSRPALHDRLRLDSHLTFKWHHFDLFLRFYLWNVGAAVWNSLPSEKCSMHKNSQHAEIVSSFLCLLTAILCLIPRTPVTSLRIHAARRILYASIPAFLFNVWENTQVARDDKRLPPEYALTSRSFSRWDKV